MSLSKPNGCGAFSDVGADGSSAWLTAWGFWLTMAFFPPTAGGGVREGGACAYITPAIEAKPTTRSVRRGRRMAAPYEFRLAQSSALNYSFLAPVSTDADAGTFVFGVRFRAIFAYWLVGNSSTTRA